MTDEAARENYEKYGNPDGPGAMKLAIGLPSFLLNPENRTQILAVFFFFILIVLPGIFFYNYSDSYLYEDTGVLKENRMMLVKKLNENMSP